MRNTWFVVSIVEVIDTLANLSVQYAIRPLLEYVLDLILIKEGTRNICGDGNDLNPNGTKRLL